jgi:hypothetical protein
MISYLKYRFSPKPLVLEEVAKKWTTNPKTLSKKELRFLVQKLIDFKVVAEKKLEIYERQTNPRVIEEEFLRRTILEKNYQSTKSHNFP